MALWYIRPQGQQVDVNNLYVLPTLFSLKLHHGGKFTKFPNRMYVNGLVDYVDYVDKDEFSVNELNYMMKELGYPEKEIISYHFKLYNKDLNFGLRALENDLDVLRFLTYLGDHKLIEIYTEYNVESSQGDVGRSQGVVVTSHGDVDDESTDGDIEDDEGIDGDVEDDEGTHGDVEYGEASDEDSDYLVDEDNMIFDVEVDMEEFKNNVENEICEESLKEHNTDDDMGLEVNLDDFDSLTDEENDPPLKRALRKERKKHKRRKDVVVEPFFVGQQFASRDEIKPLVKKLAMDSRRQLKVIRNDPVRYRVICNGIRPAFDNVGTSNATKGNSQAKVGAKKTKGRFNPPTCPWVLYISNINREESWVVKTYINEHTCLQTREVRLCTVSWLAREFESTILVNPNIPLNALQDQFQKKHQVQVSLQKVFKAKTIAKEKIEGDYRAQYEILRDYCNEIIRSNPGTTVTIDVERECNPNSPTRQFRRIYICLGALKAGFKICGRPILGLDGSFMKGPFPGQVLTAVGLDSNNMIYPVAYALVEAETKSSWCWFLECLGYDLDLDSNSNFTFISDRQKGIIPALQQVFPRAEHRYCLRHVHENMKSKWRGQLFKNLLWKCATSTTLAYFEKSMKEVESIDPALYQWLREIPPRHWSRSYFSGMATSDVLLNNLCEVFNKQLVRGRDKPIITCLEFIREYLMKRIVVVRKLISKCEGPLTPKATEDFEKIKADAANMTVMWNGIDKYQVSGSSAEQYVVNMAEKTCSCRRWELIAMPCKHVVAVMWDMASNGIEVGLPETLVSKVYWLDTWKKVYANTIDPINGRNMWTPFDCPTTLIPPKHHKQVGRPRKKRKKSADELAQVASKEGKMSRVGQSVTCKKCGNKGHNQRSCKGQTGQ